MRLMEAIHAENDQILSMVEKLEDTSAGERDQRRELLHALDSFLYEQQAVNERLVYPVFVAAEADDTLAERSRQELAEISGALKELDRLDLDDPQVKHDIESLGSLVRLHVEHEQKELLPGAEQLFGAGEEERLAARAAEFDRLKRRLQA